MSLARSASSQTTDRGRVGSAVIAILLLHAGALWGLMQIEAVREAVQDPAPIMVGLISPAPAEPPRSEPPAPPKPRQIKPKPAPQRVATDTPVPHPIAAAPSEPVVAEAPSPVPDQPAPLPVTPPNFVAAYLDNPAPRYPASSKRLGESGLVTLRVRVNAQGRPDVVEIEKSCGYPRLDRAAQDAVRNWKFVPATQGDQPVAATVLVPLNFELKTS